MFNNDQCRIFYKKNNSTITIISLSSNKVFPFIMAILKYDNLNIKNLWHKRLKHISEKGLQTLARKRFLPELQGISLKSCDHCLVEKTHRVAFHTYPSSKRSYVIDLVHTDVYTMQTRTLGGALYFVIFIDDYSRKVWAFPLKSKDQVLNVFKEFHVSVERETSRKLKCIRSDNGGEYMGPFENYCRFHGIRLEKTVPKTPQQNNPRYDRTTSDHCVFMNKFSDDDFIILLLYVDDMLIVGYDVGKIGKLKRELSKSFGMKDLGSVKQILDMKILRDRKKRKIWLSQEAYIEKVLERFNMNKAKAVCSPLAGHFKLSSKQCPTSEKEKEEMSRVPYSSVIGSLIYAMVYNLCSWSCQPISLKSWKGTLSNSEMDIKISKRYFQVMFMFW
ncbi:unnamed protein product [Musa acuminata subsp. burmannicoides]